MVILFFAINGATDKNLQSHPNNKADSLPNGRANAKREKTEKAEKKHVLLFACIWISKKQMGTGGIGVIRMCKCGKALILFLIGGATYYGIEVLWRGHSNWTMAVVGGICFLIIGSLNEKYLDWNMCLVYQSMVAAVLVTAVELVAGLVLNVWLGLGIWDYSSLPLNLWGQICLPFTLLWVILSCVAIMLDDWLRHWLFLEERPYYRLLRC